MSRKSGKTLREKRVSQLMMALAARAGSAIAATKTHKERPLYAGAVRDTDAE